MAFIEINGISVPVKEGAGGQRVQDIGVRKRSYLGDLLTTRRARKRTWQAKTPILSRHEADGIEAVAAGTGDAYLCNWSTSDTADRYSTKGAGNDATKYGAVIPGTGLDGYQVVEPTGLGSYVTESAFGSGAFTSQTGTANVLSVGAANANDVGEFSSSGATISLDSTRYVFGSSSIKAVFPAGAGDTVSTSTTSGASLSLSEVSASAYIWSDQAATIKLSIVGSAGTTVSSPTGLTAIFFVPNKWNRVELSGTMGSSDAEAYLKIETLGTAGMVTYIDGLKLEKLGFATEWSAGAGSADTNRAGGVVFDASALISPRFTIGCRARIDSSAFISSADRVLFELADFNSGGTAWFQALTVYIDASESYRLTADLRRFEYGAAAATTIAQATLTPTWDGAWDSVAVSVKSDVSSGSESTLTLFHSTAAGVQTSTTDSGDWPWPPEAPAALTTTRSIELCSSRSMSITTANQAAIDDVYMTGAALGATQAAGVAAASSEWGATPSVVLSGDIVDKPATVDGMVSAIQYRSAKTSDLSAWESQSRTLALILDEV